MKQFTHLDENLRLEILQLEKECEKIGSTICREFQYKFERINQHMIIEVIRSKKGRVASMEELFDENYESYVEVGIEIDGEYYPNGYMPIWKCKSEWFEKIGYLTKRNVDEIQSHIKAIVAEIIDGLPQIERNSK